MTKRPSYELYGSRGYTSEIRKKQLRKKVIRQRQTKNDSCRSKYLSASKGKGEYKEVHPYYRRKLLLPPVTCEIPFLEPISEKLSSATRGVQSVYKEPNYQSLLDNSSVGIVPVGIVVWNINGKVLDMNAKAKQILDVNNTDIRELNIYTFFPAEVLPRVRENVRSLPEIGIKESIHDVKGKDGTLVTCSVSTKYVSDSLCISTFIDISLQKKQEEALRIRYKIIEQSPVAIEITAPDGTIEYVNPFFTYLTGYTYEEVAGKNHRDLVSDDEGEKFSREILSTITNGKIWRGELRNHDKYGEVYWEDTTIAPVFDDKGQISHHVYVKEDVTYKKDYEQKLYVSHLKFLKILEGLEAGVLVVSIESTTILYVNRYFHKILGEDFAGESCEDFFFGQDSTLCDYLYREANGQTEYFFEKLQRWFLVNKTMIHWIDNMEVRLFVFTDITAMKEAEQLREDIERITRHDVRSPLSGILGACQLIKMDNNLQPKQKEYINMIEHAGNTVLSTINNSLTLYKVEAGTYTPQKDSVDAFSLLRHIFSQHETLADNSNLVLERVWNTESSSIQIRGEYHLWHSVLNNLLINAIEASDPFSEILVCIWEEQEWLCISIWNEKCIPTEIRDRFGEKFATAQKKHGTGLGVYSARLLTAVQGGEFAWSSDEEKGTSIVIQMPKTARNYG